MAGKPMFGTRDLVWPGYASSRELLLALTRAITCAHASMITPTSVHKRQERKKISKQILFES